MKQFEIVSKRYRVYLKLNGKVIAKYAKTRSMGSCRIDTEYGIRNAKNDLKIIKKTLKLLEK